MVHRNELVSRSKRAVCPNFTVRFEVRYVSIAFVVHFQGLIGRARWPFLANFHRSFQVRQFFEFVVRFNTKDSNFYQIFNVRNKVRYELGRQTDCYGVRYGLLPSCSEDFVCDFAILSRRRISIRDGP
jgi:hypothetical protein